MTVLDVTKKMFEKNAVRYEVDAKHDKIITSYSVGGVVYNTEVVCVRDNCYKIMAKLPIKVEKKYFALMSLYLNEVNYKQVYGKFFLNFKTGEVTAEYTFAAKNNDDPIDITILDQYYHSVRHGAAVYYHHIKKVAAGELPETESLDWGDILKETKQVADKDIKKRAGNDTTANKADESQDVLKFFSKG